MSEKTLERILDDVLLGNTFDKFKITEEIEKLKEGSSGTPVGVFTPISSKDRTKLEHLYEKLQHVVSDALFDMEFQQDRILIKNQGDLKEVTEQHLDISEIENHLDGLTRFYIDQGYNIEPLPEFELKQDPTEADSILGKTGYYEPETRKITLFILGRHPKDILRTGSHELVHHMQNLEGRLGQINQTEVSSDSHLEEIESEAYKVGNIVFRKYTESLKPVDE